MTPALTDTTSLRTDPPSVHDDETTDIEDFPDISHDAQVDGGVETSAGSSRRFASTTRTMTIAWIAIIVAMAALAGWLGWKYQRSHYETQRHAQLLQTATQTAVNLTTIDWTQADSDAQRILSSATGHFRDEFAQNSPMFIETVKKAQAKSNGTVSLAGIESATTDSARVLVAVTVTTSNAGAPAQQPRYWRMRMSVQFDGSDPKVSNVEFVP